MEVEGDDNRRMICVYIIMQILTGKTMNGAMTFILIHLVKTFGDLTYGRLLQYMHDTVQRANKQGCFSCSFLRKLLRYKKIQVIFFSLFIILLF